MAVDGRVGQCQVQHGCGGDAQFQVAADGTGDSGLPRQACDPSCGGQTAVFAGVDGQDVDGLVPDQLHGIRFGETTFVGHDRNARLASQFGHRLWVSGGDRLFGELNVEVFECRHHATCRGVVPAAVGIEADRHIRPGQVADCRESVQVARFVQPHLDLQAVGSPVEETTGQADGLVGLEGSDDHLDRDRLADLATQQVVDRCVFGLAGQVPDGHFDSGLGERIVPDHLVDAFPRQVGLAWIQSDHGSGNQLIDRCQATGSGFAAPARSQRGFAEADQPGVGFDLDDHIRRGDVFAVSRLGGQFGDQWHVDRRCGDSGDLHVSEPVDWGASSKTGRSGIRTTANESAAQA